MKLKGINPFEQHIEKIVLVGGIAAVGGVAAWQVINAPVATLGTQEVTPGEVDGLLEERARALQVQLRGESSIAIPTDGVVMAAPTFDAIIAADIAPASALTVQVPSFASTLMKMRETATDVWYHEPAFASLRMQGVVQTADALTAESAKRAIEISPTLSSRFNASGGPQDVVWTTPVAAIDLRGMRAELSRAEPEAKPPRSSIPGVWYLDTPFIVDVEFQRREVRADGSFGPAVTVPAFTPREQELDFRGRIAGAKADLRDKVFNILINPTDQAQILQMPFFETVNNSFVSPTIRSESTSTTPDGEGAADARKTLQLRTQLESKRRNAQKVFDRLAKIGGPWDEAKEREEEERKRQEERDRRDSEKGSGGGGGGGGGFGTGGGMDGRRTSPENEEAKKRKERELAQQNMERKAQSRLLQRLEAEIAELEKQLGEDPSKTASSQVTKVPNLAQDDSVLVWGHDLDVVPGHTYQYRVLAQGYNPFFARGNQLVREQDEKELDQAFTIATAESAWSAPVVVSPRVRFFVTQASAGSGQLGMGTAQVEVYRLVDGQWRRSEMQVQPGERIGCHDDRPKGGGAEIDFTTDYYVAAIVEDFDSKNADRARKPAVVVVRPLEGGPDELRLPESEINSDARVELREQAALAAEPKQGAALAPPAGGTPPPPQGGSGNGGPSTGGGGVGR